MNELIKKPYKITLWEDKNVYIVNGEKKYHLNNNDVVQNQYLEEVCIATIGSDTMDTPIRAFNPILTEDLNGSKVFTFQIYYRYWDDEEEKFKDNPFINLLVNERRIKLKYGEEEIKYQLGDINQDGVVDQSDLTLLQNYINNPTSFPLTEIELLLADINKDNKINPTDITQIRRIINGLRKPEYITVEKKPIWYEFVIKQTQENSENYIFTYTCKDLFVNELGKTGYSVELATELENNMGTITYLADKILEGSDWHVNEKGSDDLIQRNKEMLYSHMIQENETFSLTNILEGTTVTPNTNDVLLIFYSCKANYESPIQCLYKPRESSQTIDEAVYKYYHTDEYGFVTDADNYTFSIENETTLHNFYDHLLTTEFFGQKIIEKHEMHYVPQIGETCLVYTKNNTRYYCYKELEYASVSQIQNMLSNSCGFISTNAWVPDSGSSNSVALSYSLDTNYPNAIRINGSVYNTGFYDNRALLSPNGFIAGETYILAVKSSGTITGGTVRLIPNPGNGNNIDIITFSAFNGNVPTELTGYLVYSGSVGSGNTVTYFDLINNYNDIRFYIGHNGTIDLEDCKVFKYRVDNNGKMIVPDLQDTEDSIIKTRYYFFEEDSLEDLGALYTKEKLPIIETILEEDLDNSGYEPVIIEGHQKVTSITGSKSNRFNLIQSLCEAFECWAKFDIEHDEIGRTTYQYVPISDDDFVSGGRYYTRNSGSGTSSEDTLFTIYNGESYISGLYQKVYDKYVTFKEYIGDDNLVGFRYGINLKSIQRNLVSDQIASKVIVQSNTNEFAPNGSCTIQQSVLNPTGENALYNFQYFINQGLIDSIALYNDLYGENNGLGFYPRMRNYNNSIQPKIEELTEISSTLYNLKSRQTVYNSLLQEAQRLIEETNQEIAAAGYNGSRNYTAVSSPSGNPKKKGWYEKNDNIYSLTKDTSVQSGKTYYKAASVGATSSSSAPDYIKTLRDKLTSYSNTESYYTTLASRNGALLESYTQKYNALEENLESIREKKDKLVQDFENKYYRFIQEGTWTSQDYWDPELYYQAANMVLYTSSFPQVSYTINVIELSQVEGFEPYKFKIGDKTYVEDIEFFGYDKQDRPYKEEIVVSQVKINLDDPSQNTITVRNYKTQFQDLFQRMAASSQSLQYHEGEYNRAASAVNDDGTINSALMQNTLESNALIISNASNQSVTWDETGITIGNFLNANEVVRLTSSGIALTKDGGRTWTTGITGDGVSADVITAGRIDTDRIRIFNAAMQQTFEWNDKGINAYMWESAVSGTSGTTDNVYGIGDVNYGKFVRFDKYGIYGYAGGDPDWNPNSINDVITTSDFSLTWKGLHLNLSDGQGFSQVINPTGSPKENVYYEYNPSTGKYFMSTDETVDNEKTYFENNDKVINVNNKFTVDGAGNVFLTGNINLSQGNIIWGGNEPMTSVDSQDIYDAIKTDTTPFQGLFYTNNNQLLISADYIKAGSIDADMIEAGTLTVDKIYDSSGQDYITNNAGKVVANYLSLYGTDVTGTWGGSSGQTTFGISNNGTVTIRGKIYMSSDSVVYWDNLDSTTQATFTAAASAADDVHDLAAGTYNKAGTTFISNKTIYSPTIYAATFYASDSTSSTHTTMTANGLQVLDSSNNKKILLGAKTNGWAYPFLQLGAGTTAYSADAGLMMKFGYGLWLGTNDVISQTLSNKPVVGQNSEGLFINFTEHQLKLYTNGGWYDLLSGTAIATFG